MAVTVSMTMATQRLVTHLLAPTLLASGCWRSGVIEEPVVPIFKRSRAGRGVISIALFAFFVVQVIGCRSASTNGTPNDADPTIFSSTENFHDVRGLAEDLKREGVPIGEPEYSKGPGRRDSYAEQAIFRDERLPLLSQTVNIDEGGAIELYLNAGNANARNYHLIDEQQGRRTQRERLYVFRNAVLRLSARLTSEQAGDYEAAFRKLLGFGYVGTL